MIAEGEVLVTAVAADLDVTHTALTRIVDGTTQNPHPRNRRAIIRWVLDHSPKHEFSVSRAMRQITREVGFLADEEEPLSPEQELLEYFLEHHQQMATLMARSVEGSGPEDRRKVALALLNAFKRMAIEAGEKIPPFFFELERKFVEE
jgi:hypothetical protein